MEEQQKSRLDAIFSVPALAVGLAIFCNIMWGSAFPFIKMGYQLFQINTEDTASILCFAGIRFMLAAVLVYVSGSLLHLRPMALPKGKLLANSLGLGLLQTTVQYACYYTGAALLTGALGGIVNSTQSLMGVILAHFLYGDADRMTRRKALGCVLGFGGVLVVTFGNHGSGSMVGIICMLGSAVAFTAAGAWNKWLTKTADSFMITTVNLGFGGAVLYLIGLCTGGSIHPGSPAAIPVIVYLACVSAIGYVMWALLVKNNPLSRISVFALLIPMVNVLLSAVLNGEPLFEMQYLIALVLMCSGIWLVNRG